MMVCVSVGRPESDCHVTVTKLSSGSDNDEIDHHGAPVSLRTSAVLQYFINYEDVLKETQGRKRRANKLEAYI